MYDDCFITVRHPSRCGALSNTEKEEPHRAFQSLSFKGKRGYSNNFITTRQPKCAASCLQKAKTYGGILQVNDRYALVQGRYTGKWSFPKGHTMPNETPIECTLREIAEETGIDTLPQPTDYRQIGYGNYYDFNLTESPTLVPRDVNEIQDTKWATLEEMKSMSLNADVSMFLRQKLNIEPPVPICIRT
jgi:8-oxo-dGTP pyrophosphatase MutT (NUDIX family)